MNHKNEYNFHILCLSSGFPAEEQKIKEKEFEKCCQFLELKKFLLLQEDLLLYNEAKTWPISYISNKIIDYIQINNIKAIIAFDEYAINGESGRNAISKAIRSLNIIKYNEK